MPLSVPWAAACGSVQALQGNGGCAGNNDAKMDAMDDDVSGKQGGLEQGVFVWAGKCWQIWLRVVTESIGQEMDI
jgi:hypothetical protein